MSVLAFIEHLYKGQMDFVGQRRAFIFQLIVIAIGTIIGFFVGFANQSFLQTFQISFAFASFAALAVVPSWPWWNRHPIKWLDDKKAQ
jgi:signal peptidase complex subunit 1